MTPHTSFGGTRKLALLAAFIVQAAFSQRTYNCGNLNQRACSHNDWERINMVAGENHACEPDLIKVDGYCRNRIRNTTFVRYNNRWYGWALEDQMYGIGKDTPINFITWPAAHNTYSSESSGFGSGNYTNHTISTTDQLNYGIRHLELDPKYYLMLAPIGLPFSVPPIGIPIPISDNALRVCHAFDVKLCILPGFQSRLFGFALTEIAQWLDANPGQVIYIKLDNIDLGDDISKLFDEVERYLGNRVYKVPSGTITRWPTIQEIRNAGKSVILARHNANSPATSSPWVWDASGAVQVSNWPKNQDFENCRAYDGFNPIERGNLLPRTWWDTAEGRTKLNSGAKNTGLYWEGEVEKAAKCGVAVIGLDFVHGLNSQYNVSYRATPDDRLTYVVWSWAADDWGRAGPAYQDPASHGRWRSVDASTVLPLACALKQPYGSTNQDRGWRITGASIPWNKSLGDEKCSAEFGSTYEFAFPVNGFQNQKLKQAAGGRPVWLAYSTVPTPNASFSARELTFRMDPGGSLPQSQLLRITATPGTQGGAKLVGNLPLTFSLPPNALASGDFTMNVGIGASAATLPSGEYQGTLDFGLTAPYSTAAQAFSLAVKLIVRSAPSVSAFPGSTSAPNGSPVTLSAVLKNAKIPQGIVKFYRIYDSRGIPVGQETVAAATLDSVVSTAKAEVSNLPLGTHTYVASYPGDANNLPDDSEPFTVTITPRIMASPQVMNFAMQLGGSLPSSQTANLTGLGASPTAAPGCNWAKSSITASTLTVAFTDAAQSLPVGVHVCNILLRDALSVQGLGETSYPIQLNVRTQLLANPGSVTLSSSTVPTTNVVISASGNAAVAPTATASHPWITTEFQSTQTPATLQVSVDPQNLPTGTSTAQIVLSSPLAESLTIPVTYNKFGSTTIATKPAGLTVTVDGVSVSAPATFTWQPGTQHTISAPNQISGNVRYTAGAWLNGSNPLPGNPVTIVASPAGGTFVARFQEEYRLSAIPVPTTGGSILVTPASSDGFYQPNAVVQLAAAASQGNTFTGWAGDLSGIGPTQNITMSGPKSVIAGFTEQKPLSITLTSNLPAAKVTVDGKEYVLPTTFLWVQGEQHQIAAPTTVSGGPGSQWIFSRWSNDGPPTQTFTTPAGNYTLASTYSRQFLLATTASPAAGGTVAGGGWYNEGATASVQATAASGYNFSGFAGDATGTVNPVSVAMTAPKTVSANFAAVGQPQLTALSAGARANGPTAGQRTVPIALRNTGTGVAQGAAITGISGIMVRLGTGEVSLVTPAPISYGDVMPGSMAQTSLTFNWPGSAQRVQFTVNFTSLNGVPGSTTLTLFR